MPTSTIAAPLHTTPRTTAASATLSASHLSNAQITFRVDPDILLACEDQAKSQGIPLGEWFQQTLNDSLRGYLGI